MSQQEIGNDIPAISEDKVVNRAAYNADFAYNYFSKNNIRYLENLRFVHGDQWSDEAIAAQTKLGKPASTFNKIYPYYKQLIGESRTFTPSYKLRDERLSGDPLPQKMLDQLSDVMRQIDVNSKADEVFSIAFQNMLMGFGVVRIVTERDKLNPFMVTLKYLPVWDSTAAFFDPAANHRCKTDGEFCGITSLMSKQEFKQRYNRDVPKVDIFAQYPHLNRRQDKESVLLLDYDEREYFQQKMLLLSNKQVIKAENWEKVRAEFKKANNKNEGILPLLSIVKKQMVTSSRIKRYKIAGDEVLEKATVWESEKLPLIYCDGDSIFADGEQVTIGFSEVVHDAQRFLNYLKSDIAYTIQTLRRELFLGTDANVPDEESQRKWADVENVQGLLTAKIDPNTGQLPTRLPIPEIPQSLLQQAQATEFDIMSGLGMFEASRGQSGQEISGVAIDKRIGQSNLTNSVYYNNLLNSRREAAQIVAAVIPVLFNSEQAMVVRNNEDGKRKDIVINEENQDSNLTESLLRVEIQAGAPFKQQRQEELQTLLSIVQASGDPQLFNLLADKIGEYVDSAVKPTIVQRLKTLVPPEALAASGETTDIQPKAPTPNPLIAIEQQKAQAATTTANARMLDSQVKVESLHQDAGETQVKANAELQKARLELLKELVKNP